jgi:Domain of unknown function (DUF4836)
MRLKPLILAMLVFITGTNAFAQTNPLYKYIQPGSRMLMSFNLLKIAAKVPGETFRSSGMYQDMLKNDKGTLRSLLADPTSSGIDFSTDFILSTGPAENENSTTVLIGHLADQGKFAALMEKMNESSDSKVQVFGTNRLILPKRTEPAIAWNDEVFVITGMGGGKKELNAVFADTTDTRDMEVRMNEVTERIRQQTKELCFAALTPKNNGTFFNSAVLTALMNETGDIKIWNSGETATNTKALKKLPPFFTQFLSRMQAANGSEKTSVINFEKGKIAGTVRTYLSPEMGALYQKYPQELLPTGLVRRLPEGKILMLMMSAVNKDMAREMSLKNGMSEMMDSLKQYLKMDLSLFQKGFKNNALMAIMQFPPKEETDDTKKNFLENMGLFIVLPVADKAAVASLKELADRKLDSMAHTEKGEKMMRQFRPAILYNDSLCVVALSEAMAQAYLNNPGTAKLPDWLPASQPGSMWMNLNFREIMMMVFNMAGKPGRDRDKQAMEMLSTFDQMIVTGGDFSNGSLNSRMEFRFSNPDKNVLEQLFEMANRITQDKAKASSESFTPPVIVQDEEVTDAPKEAPPAKKKAPVKKPAAKTKGKN